MTPYNHEADVEQARREAALSPDFPTLAQMFFRIPPPMRGKTLDDYVTRTETQVEAKKTVAALLALIVKGKPMNPIIPGLTIIGHPGVGKTLLACIVLNHAHTCRKSFDFMPVADFVKIGHSLIDTAQRGLRDLDEDDYYRYRALTTRIDQLTQVKVLVLDDFGKEHSKAATLSGAASWAESEFDRIIRNRWNTGAGPTIITSNIFIEHWDARYRESLSSFLHEATAILSLKERADWRK